MTTLDNWIQHEAIPFSVDSPDAAIDQLMNSLDTSIEVLGFGEPLHGGKEFLILRNRLFQRLVEVHGYSAIAVESSFPKSYYVNEYVMGRGPSSYDTLKDIGFSHGFGQLEANRELIEWMREYNAAHEVKIRFYGFDSPTEATDTDSPRQVLTFVLDYLAFVDSAAGEDYRQRIEQLLGEDAAWANPAAIMDPTQAIGLTPEASALRLETENLISELLVRRPEFIAKSDTDRYLEAMQFASVARQLLNYHAELARASDQRLGRLLGIRDALMADMVTSIVTRERGKVFLFAHNTHLKHGADEWRLWNYNGIWWPAGAQLTEIFGSRYAVIGSALGESSDNGIGQPEIGTLEARLMTTPGSARFIPMHKELLPEVEALPVRSGSTVNYSYFPLTDQSITDFDWLVLLNFASGGPPWLKP
jgi:erythromycin esterase